MHGVCCLYDHVLKTNLKAVCVVFLYYTDGGLIRFPINLRIFYKQEGSGMPWEKGQPRAHKTKNELALEMIEQALAWNFPKSTVLADSWFCVSPFIQGLEALGLPYVLEMKSSYQIKVPCASPKRTPKGRLAKKQFGLFSPEKFFERGPSCQTCGLEWDENTGKAAKVLYHAKIATVEFNAFSGKFRVVQSINPVAGTTKYFLSNQLHWDAVKILGDYSHRWVIEEFFRNAKQLCDLEGASLRSEQGVTLSLYLVSWIDFLLHHQNYKNVSEKLTKESLSIPSIIRIAQAQNAEAFIQHIQHDPEFTQRWISSFKENILRPKKGRKPLVPLLSAQTMSLPVLNP
ncbi:transposase [Deltaproteobacteria bacterium TL4]